MFWCTRVVLALGLVLGLAACNAFSDISPELCDMRAFWSHASACGVYASLLAGACPGAVPDRAFVGGLLAAPLLYTLVLPLPEVRIEVGSLQIIVAGLLVGIGTRYGAGCTSGHGVCGISRLSPRSVVATLVFMAAGFATVFVLRHWLG